MVKEDVPVTIENSVLALSGERRFENTKKDDFHRIERRYGSFFRSSTLPNRVDSEKVKATFKDGVLHLTIPNTEEVKPRRIAIH